MMQEASVRLISECFIKPKHINVVIDDNDESKKAFYLGSFELLQMSQYYLQMGLLYNNKQDGGNKPEFLESLKQSLSNTLAHFYPLAGQLATEIEEDTQKSFIYVDCKKGPGAKFIHASLEGVTMDTIISPTYVPNRVESFFDLGRKPRNYEAHDEPMLAIQVTELVDGLFFGISVNHSIVDGTTLWHFLSSWSEIHHSNDNDIRMISRPPICKRWFPEGHGPILKIPNNLVRVKCSVERNINNSLKEAIFHLSSKAIASLKEKANAECGVVNKISSFQVLSAALWRSIVRSRPRVQDEEDSVCFIMANARSRMVPPLSQSYLGSFILPAINQIKVSELVENSFGKVALSVHQVVAGLTNEYFVEKFLQWINSPYLASVGPPSPNSVVISGTPREGNHNVEFGLGNFVVLRTGSNKFDGKVVIFPGNQGQGSVTVQICLSPDAMLALQKDKEFVFLQY